MTVVQDDINSELSTCHIFVYAVTNAEKVLYDSFDILMLSVML